MKTGKMNGTVLCHKCRGLLVYDDSSLSINGGALCIICGFVDYSFSTKNTPTSSDGLIYIVNYIGTSTPLKYKTIQIKLKRGTFNKFDATCPFCEEIFWIEEYTSTSIRKATIKRSTVKSYKCSVFHRFQLHVDNDENNLRLGWE